MVCVINKTVKEQNVGGKIQANQFRISKTRSPTQSNKENDALRKCLMPFFA